MKKYIYAGLLAVALLSALYIQQRRISALKDERNTYRENTYALLSDMEQYRTKDSLYVASIEELCLTVDEYKKYRQSDMKLIESLRVDRSRLQQIVTAQMETVYELRGTFRDSVPKNRFTESFQKADTAFDSIYMDTLKCIAIKEKWFDLSGCIDANDKFTGRFENRDSLLYVEHIIPKRFWFIKWGVKERRQEIVSKNPHTRIIGAEFVTVRK
jgi:hypothetical protein